MFDASWQSMETLSHARESASTFFRQAASPLRSTSQQVSRDFSGWATTAMETMRVAIFRIGYVVRGTVIQWCLALANHLQKAQAHAITREAWAMGQGHPDGVTIPPPSFPHPERSYSPYTGVSSPLDVPQAQSSSFSNRELQYDDFDDAPTEVYHPIPTNEVSSGIVGPYPDTPYPYPRHPYPQRGVMQGAVHITSK